MFLLSNKKNIVLAPLRGNFDGEFDPQCRPCSSLGCSN